MFVIVSEQLKEEKLRTGKNHLCRLGQDIDRVLNPVVVLSIKILFKIHEITFLCFIMVHLEHVTLGFTPLILINRYKEEFHKKCFAFLNYYIFI